MSAKKPKPTLHAVTDEEVRPLEDADEAGRLCGYCAGHFPSERRRFPGPLLGAHSLRHQGRQSVIYNEVPHISTTSAQSVATFALNLLFAVRTAMVDESVDLLAGDF